MKSTIVRNGMPICVGLGILIGIMFEAWLPGRTAQAATSDLPPIFQVGAELSNTVGDVRIMEIEGSWIRVKSLNPMDDKGGENWWIYVPAQSGAWREGHLYDVPVPQKKK